MSIWLERWKKKVDYGLLSVSIRPSWNVQKIINRQDQNRTLEISVVSITVVTVFMWLFSSYRKGSFVLNVLLYWLFCIWWKKKKKKTITTIIISSFDGLSNIIIDCCVINNTRTKNTSRTFALTCHTYDRQSYVAIYFVCGRFSVNYTHPSPVRQLDAFSFLSARVYAQSITLKHLRAAGCSHDDSAQTTASVRRPWFLKAGGSSPRAKNTGPSRSARSTFRPARRRVYTPWRCACRTPVGRRQRYNTPRVWRRVCRTLSLARARARPIVKIRFVRTRPVLKPRTSVSWLFTRRLFFFNQTFLWKTTWKYEKYVIITSHYKHDGVFQNQPHTKSQLLVIGSYDILIF